MHMDSAVLTTNWEIEMSNEITLTTKTGKTVHLSAHKGTLLASVPAASIFDLSVTGHVMGLQSCIGQKIILSFEGGDMARCQEWLSARTAEIEAAVSQSVEYQRRHDMIERTR